MVQIFQKIQVGVILTCIFSIALFGSSQIDKLLQSNNVNELKTIIQATKVIHSEHNLPSNPKENELIILENDYGIKSLFEYNEGQWNDKVDSTIAKLLQNDKGTTYKNLFNYKVDAAEFNPYESDNFKYNENVKQNVKIVFINSVNKSNEINKNLNSFLDENKINTNQIINIQLNNLEQQNCQIVLIYKQ